MALVRNLDELVRLSLKTSFEARVKILDNLLLLSKKWNGALSMQSLVLCIAAKSRS